MVVPNSATKVSAIVSIYKSKRYIQKKLENLITQTLFQQNELEIVLIDSNSPENEFEIIDEYLKKYPNINYLRTPERESIYQAWNRAIKISKGKYITNSNTDDILKEDALEIMANELDSNNDINLVYADYFITNIDNSDFYDHIRSGYGIKPDYDKNIMLYGCHMGPFPMWKKELHSSIGYFDESIKSASDYEFWCRIAANNYKMKHLDQILGLYLNNCTGYANSNAKNASQETQLIKQKYRDQLPTPANNLWTDVCYSKFILNNNFVNIGITTYNRLEFTKQTINSILRFTDYPHRITVVDNNSQDGTKEYLLELKTKGIINSLVLLNENIGVAKASNIAWLMEPDAEYYLKLDNDIVFQKLWLKNMVKHIKKNKKLGAVGYNFEPISYPLQNKKFTKLRYKKKGNLGGACILIPKRTCLKLGYWSEEYGLYGEEDADYGARIRYAGLLNAYLPDEDIGLHLPAGKAAIINPETFKAEDGLEEDIHKDYREWKDDLRKKNVQEGSFVQNMRAYKRYQKSLFAYPSYALDFIKINYPDFYRELGIPKLGFMHLINLFLHALKYKLKKTFK